MGHSQTMNERNKEKNGGGEEKIMFLALWFNFLTFY